MSAARSIAMVNHRITVITYGLILRSFSCILIIRLCSTEVTVITTLLIGNHDAKANERALRSTSPERRPLGDDGVSNLRVAAILSHRPEIFSIARSFYDSPGAPWSPYPLCPMDNPATERKIKSWAQRCSLEGRERRETNRVRKQKERGGGEKSEKREREKALEGRGGALVEQREGPR